MWRGAEIKDPDYAVINGYLGLFISPDGLSGSGTAYGILSFKLAPAAGTTDLRTGDFHISHEISHIECEPDSRLLLTSRLQVLRLIRHDGGELPESLKKEMDFEPWTFRWQLRPTAETDRFDTYPWRGPYRGYDTGETASAFILNGLRTASSPRAEIRGACLHPSQNC